MASAASCVIGGVSHNRTINSLSSPLPKHGNIAVYHHHHHSKVNLLSFSHPQHHFHCVNSRIFTPSCLAKTAVSDVELHSSNPTTAAADSWSEFARNVSGEWDGFGADFSVEGSPTELPESVVPEAYREWEVKYSIDERNIGGVDNKVSAFAYQSSGCYAAIWPVAESSTHEVWELEHCLINPRDKESRVRIIQVVRTNIGIEFVLQNIRVFCEQWYGPFRNGDQLGGCAIRDSVFASTAATKASDVIGVWQGQNVVANFDGSGNALRHNFDEQNVLPEPDITVYCELVLKSPEPFSRAEK
ncbi:hypothetical protein CCACVL1_03975 [Corchorus capsularis]|uniref:Uncharacterized protein n=1 Tax=Corchorus capsularis TaxID=210143 RepID=A0A1R3JW28_COCAP|nr:hypothetical protein CCACVL1_03975 [Corchorus capsularis]